MIDVRDLQFSKALYSIIFTLLGIVIDDKVEALAKADTPILVTGPSNVITP